MRHYRIDLSIASMCRLVLLLALIAILNVGCAALRNAGCDEILSVGSDGMERSNGHLIKGVKHFDHGKLQAAADEFQRAISFEQSNGTAHNNLGLIYYQQRKLSDAAKEFELAAQFLAEDSIPWNNLGMTLEAAGRGLESIEYYQHAYELAPEKPQYLGNLVRTRIRLGENDETVIAQLKELFFIETRPDWVTWINDQLAIEMNPMLDRGPAPPSLQSKNKTSASSEKRERRESQMLIEEIQPAPIINSK